MGCQEMFIINPYNHYTMKKITISIKEFYLFKQVAKFMYEFSLTNNDSITIKADAYQLEQIGY
jgi:hypothetical protein